MARAARWGIPILAGCAVASVRCSCEHTNAPAAPADAFQDASPDAHGVDSGTGDAGAPDTQSPDAAADGGMQWLSDLAYWKPMPDAKQCEVYHAEPMYLPPASRTWADCGAGCQASPAQAIAGLPPDVARRPTGAAFVGGAGFLRTYSLLPGANPNLWVLSRLSDGEVLGAVQFRNWQKCFGYAMFAGSPDVAPVVEPDSGMRIARFTLDAPQPPGWSPWNHELPVYTTGFAASAFWGLTTLAGDVAVGGWPAGTLAPVDTSSVTFSSAARDDVAVWTTRTGANKGVVKAYSPTTKNVWTLVDQAASDASRVALASSRIYWVGVTGPLSTSGSYESSMLWMSDFASGATIVAPTQVANLKAVAGLLDLHVSNDHAATIGCFPGPDGGLGSGVAACPVLVVSASTGKQWRLPSRPGKVFHTVLSLSDQELLLGEANDPSDPTASQRIDTLVRLRLDALDALQNGWTK